MKNFNLLKVAICVMAVVSVTMFNSGCEKENLEDLKQTYNVKKPRIVSDDEIMKDLPEVKDGRLVFKDSVSFANYVQWLFDNQDNVEKIYGVNASLGFVCMHEIYDKGLELLLESESATCPYIEEHPTVFHASEVDGSIIQDLQALDLVGYVANEYGVFQVGKKIYRSTYNYTYCITNGDENKIQTLLNLKEGNTGDVYISSNPTFFNIAQTRDIGDYSYRTAYFLDNRYRAVARLRGGYYLDVCYSIYQAEVNAQYKNAIGIWVGKKLDGVTLEFSSGYYTYVYTGPRAQLYGTDYHTVNTTDVSYTANSQSLTRTFCQPGDLYSYMEVIPTLSSRATTHKVKRGNEYATIHYTNAFTGAY